jgi:N4-gp56 family major capsid protein
MRTEDWKDMNKYTKPEKFEQGYIGEIDNCRFYISTNAKIWDANDETTGDVAVYGCVFLADGAFGTTEISGGGMETIVKQLGSAGSADPLDQRSTVGWKGTKGSVVLVDDYIVRVECASSRGANAKTN